MKFIILNLLFVIQVPAAFAQTTDLMCGGIFINEAVSVPAQVPVIEKEAKQEIVPILSRTELEEVKKIAEEFVSEVTKLEDKIRFWSDLTGKYERGYLFQLRERRQFFEFYLRETGEVYKAIGIYANIFKAVELSYFKLKEYYQNAKPGQPLPPEMLVYAKNFGENYGDYIYVRSYLDGLAKTDISSKDSNREEKERLQDNAIAVLRGLGLPKLLERFPELRQLVTSGAERPSVEDLRRFWNDKTEPLIFKLKRDLAQERILTVKVFISSFLQLERIRNWIHAVMPLQVREPITKFLGFNYNSYVLHKYLPDIELIMGASGEGRVRTFEEMFNKYNQVSSGTSVEFLTTFARIGTKEKRTVWLEMRNKMASMKKTDSAYYGKIEEEMKKAEDNVKKTSVLSELHKPSLIDQFTAWIAPLGLGVGAYYLSPEFQTLKDGAISFWQSLGF